MRLIDKLQQIEQLQAVETPWVIKRVLGSISLFGSQICFINEGISDYVSHDELKEVLDLLVADFGGTIVWEDKAVANAPLRKGKGAKKQKAVKA